MTVGENIKKFRKKRGLTQKQLGEKCGIDEANLRKYELDKQSPRIETLRKIAIALDVYTYDLLYDPETAAEKSRQDIAEAGMQFINKGYLELPDDADVVNDVLLRNFNKLNKSGKKEAYKRVGELTEIPRYTRKEE